MIWDNVRKGKKKTKPTQTKTPTLSYFTNKHIISIICPEQLKLPNLAEVHVNVNEFWKRLTCTHLQAALKKNLF